MLKDEFYIGIDIQTRKNCCYTVISESGILVEPRWFSSAEVDAVDLLKRLSNCGSDGIGTIILSRPLPDPVIKEVLEWSFSNK